MYIFYGFSRLLLCFMQWFVWLLRKDLSKDNFEVKERIE